jgi:hypothetical protein
MELLKAQVEDVDGIHEINQFYLKTNLPDNSNGFLLGDHSKEWILANLNRYYVVKEESEVLGYAELDFQIVDENFASGIWESESFKKIVLEKIKQNQFIYMVQLASNKYRRGIGKIIVESLTNKFPDSIIISFVAFKPFFNEVSLMFHEKMGFQKAGIFTQKFKFGIHGYEHICYFK